MGKSTVTSERPQLKGMWFGIVVAVLAGLAVAIINVLIEELKHEGGGGLSRAVVVTAFSSALVGGSIGGLVDHRASRNTNSTRSRIYFLIRDVLLAVVAYVWSLVTGIVVSIFVIIGTQ